MLNVAVLTICLYIVRLTQCLLSLLLLAPSQPLMPNLAPPNLSTLTAQFASMPFMNPFLSYNMNLTMPWNINVNNNYSLYASQLANAMNSDLSKIEPVNAPKTKSQTLMVETEPSSSKPMVANSGKKSNVENNKAGPKIAWVPKIT